MGLNVHVDAADVQMGVGRIIRIEELVMRKNIALAASMVALAGVLGVAGCSGGGSGAQTAQNGTQTSGQLTDGSKSTAMSKKGDIAVDELGDVASADVESVVASLNEELDGLVAETGTIEAYVEKIEKVQGYYDKVLSETEALCVRLRQYGVNCANTVLGSDRTNGQMYDDLEVIYDDLYDSAGEDAYDAIYDDLFERLYDAYYDGVVSDAYDSMGYGEWSEISSAAYEMYSDAKSEVYEIISDCRSDIYEFGSDVRGDVFADKFERAQKEIADFQEDIDEMTEQ